MAKVVVIGGGFAGLSAAVRLAKLHHHVTLVEQKDILGGELRGLERDGVTWQTHREVVTLPGVFRDLFRKSGRQLERTIDFEQIRGRRHIFKDSLVLDLPMGNRGDQHEVLMDAFDSDEWSPWVDTLAPVWDSLRRVALDRTFSGKSDFDSAQWKAIAPRRSIAVLAKRDIKQYYLRKMILDPIRIGGHDRRFSPGFLAVSHYVDRNFGLWKFPGGRPALADALTDRVQQRKVDVVFDTTATGIRFSDGIATGVETSDGVIPADIVIWCAPNHPPPLRPSPELRSIPASRTYVTLDDTSLGGAEEIFIHANPPVRMWKSEPGRWTIEHGRGEDVLMSMARCGLDLRDLIVDSWEQAPIDLVGQCHWGWQWQGASTAFNLPGVKPTGGVYLAGAHAHPGGSLEMIGMATAAIAEAVGSARH